jgi:MoaA/NifB/PqqE/SkfB family radical SAM enzyme
MTTAQGVRTREGTLMFDASKIRWHHDRVEELLAGERVAPVTIDLALSRGCSVACRACYAVAQEPRERENITVDAALRFVDDCAEIGVRGLSMISDGESTLSKAYVPFIERCAEVGMDVGNATNGLLWTDETMERILPILKWVRFTVLAGTPASYARMMYPDATRTDLFWKAMRNISTAVEIKRKRKLPVTLSIQTFLTPDDAAEVRAFAQLALDLKVQAAVLKHTSDDENRSFGVEYARYHEIEQALRDAEAMSNEDTKVIVKWSKIRSRREDDPARMWACPLLLQVSGSGLVAPNGMFFQNRHAKLHVGNICDEPFRDIFRSDRYWQAMQYLVSPAFDARLHMGALPIAWHANVALDRHVKGIERIVPAGPDEPKPLHLNFL